MCSWNLQLGRKLDGVLETLAGEPDLDLVALQEVSERDGRTDAGRIAGALGRDYDSHQAAVQRVRGLVQANAVVWNRRRLRNACGAAFALPSMALAGLPGWEARLLGGLREQTRGSVFVEGALEGDPLRMYSVHLDVFGFAHRVRQLTAVFDHAAEMAPDALTVVAGDLNTFGLPGFPTWEELRGAASLAGFEDASAEIPWTHRAAWLRQKLDAVLVRSRQALTHRAWTQPSDASDHLPVFVELRW